MSKADYYILNYDIKYRLGRDMEECPMNNFIPKKEYP